MIRRYRKALLTGAVSVGLLWATGCSTTGNNELECSSTEVAPHTQPGAATSKEAFEWYLKNELPGDDRASYERTGNSETRHIYWDGRHQISVSALPTDDDQPPVWVVLMTYDCS